MPVVTGPPYVGRDAELCLLRRQLGGPGVVVVEGEAGIGKTRLVTEALARAGCPGRTVRGGGSEYRRRPPFGALGRLLGGPPFDTDRFRHVLDDVLGTGPLTVVLEDVQWVDPAWLDAIPGVLSRLGPRPVLLVLTARPVPRGAEVVRLAAALHDHEAIRISLRGLDPAATAVLGGSAAPGLVERTGGNPQLIVELAAAGHPAPGSLPHSFTAALLRRLAPLPAPTGEVLRVAAVLGRRFDVADLARLAGETVVRLLPVLRSAMGAGLLVEDGSRLAFRHGLLQEALVADMPRPVLTAVQAEAEAVRGAADTRLAELADLRERAPRAAATEAGALLADRVTDPVIRARLHAEQARALLACGDATGAATAATRAVGRPGDEQAGCVGRAVLAVVASGMGRTALGVNLAEDALRRSRRPGSAPVRGFVHHAHVTALLRADRLNDADAALATHGGAGQRALVAFRLGRWDDGPDGPVADPVVAAMHAMIAVHRNDLTRAGALLEPTVAPGCAQWLGWARGLYAEARGHSRDAADELRQAWAACTRTGVVVDYPLLGPDLVRLLLAVDDRLAALDACAQVTEIASRSPSPAARSSALRCTAVLDADAHAATAAVELLAGLPLPLAVAQAREEAAAVVEGVAAVELLAAAAEGYRLLGANRDLARVYARLRDLGVRRGPRGRRTTATHGWDSLTATERTVVALAAQGMTNREIGGLLYVSPRTVETHLTHVFAKLDLTGRAALRAAVTARDYGGLPDVPRAAPRHHRALTTTAEGPGR